MSIINSKFEQAFKNRTSLTFSNTTCDENNVWLHGNLIIKRVGVEIWATLAGWNTVTTRSRLDGVLPQLKISCSKGQAYVESPCTNGPVGDDEWFRVS